MVIDRGQRLFVPGWKYPWMMMASLVTVCYSKTFNIANSVNEGQRVDETSDVARAVTSNSIIIATIFPISPHLPHLPSSSAPDLLPRAF
jgi:hypothetical protein